MDRRKFVKNSVAIGVSSFIPLSVLQAMAGSIAESKFAEELMDKNDIIPAPENPAEWPAWREALNQWKLKKQTDLKYDGGSYRSKPFEWVTTDYSCCFIMMCDAEFYDYTKNEYRISSLLKDGKDQYGGYDSVVLWHAYPRIGLDDRNQFDFYRDMPQGLPGLKKVVKEFHDANVRVFIDYNPWDTGTRREPKPDIEGLIEIIKGIDADGIFLDTMKDAPEFREKLDVVKPGIVLEGEIALPLVHIQSHHMSWAQGFKDSKVPGVYRNKWFEHRHMQHAIHRWGNDKSTQLHTAWMNGSGIMIWENIFGQWIGWNERDKSIYRTMYAIQHHFHRLFSGDGWTPLSQESPQAGVFISSWQAQGMQLWTLINRNESPVNGVLMNVQVTKGLRCFDLIKGEEINVKSVNEPASFYGNICSRGIACFLSIDKAIVDSDFKEFLVGQKNLFNSASYDTTTPIKNNRLISKKVVVKPAGTLSAMVKVPAATIDFNLEYTLNEIGSYGNAQEHLAISATHKQFEVCRFSKKVEISQFAMDETPVTNLMFKEFVDLSGYIPRIRENYLKHWIGGAIPAGKEHHPVVYVDLEDARAYARWAGKRLPSEFEWQFTAQGVAALNYPWGNEMLPGKCNQNTNGTASAVKAFPEGISPLGCYDMCGNTWELTESEYSDGRTRFVMLKGGSCFKAKGSHWYTDGGPQNNGFLAKMLLTWPGLDRCATIGFRCAVDL